MNRSNLYRHGLFSGWTEYRYGESRGAITLAKPAAIFRGAKRKSVVAQVVDVLRDWRCSPFQYEGLVTTGIRSALCEQGFGWTRSNFEASEIVAASLNRIGAKRPTWEQGQPEYTDRRENCAWCRRAIDAGFAAKAMRYCSAECAQAAKQKAEFRCRSESDKKFAAVQRVIKKARSKPRTCRWCSQTFHPVSDASGQSCCSYSCAARLKASTSTVSYEKRCDFCYVRFVAKKPFATHCSRACLTASYALRRGRRVSLKANIFDHYFAMAA